MRCGGKAWSCKTPIGQLGWATNHAWAAPPSLLVMPEIKVYGLRHREVCLKFVWRVLVLRRRSGGTRRPPQRHKGAKTHNMAALFPQHSSQHLRLQNSRTKILQAFIHRGVATGRLTTSLSAQVANQAVHVLYTCTLYIL
jgi:hypothetical protein